VAVLGSWLPSDPHGWANPALNLGFDGHDITSGLPDDITMTTVTLTTGHGQTATSRFLMMSHHKIAHPGYQTDITVRMVTLTAEC